jgi:hypothetical protein
LKAF